MTDSTEPDYPSWFRNPLNTRIKISQNNHYLSDASYWQAKALSKDHVLVEMHFFMSYKSFTTNEDISHALSNHFPYDYSIMVEDIIKGVSGTRDSFFVKNKEDKRKVLLLTPLGVYKPSVFHNDDGDLIATWKAVLLVSDSDSHESLKHIVDVIREAGCNTPITFIYTTRVWRSERAWEDKIVQTHGEKYLEYLNIHTSDYLIRIRGWYLSWLDFKWENLDDAMFDPEDSNCTKWLTRSIIEMTNQNQSK